MSRHKPFRRSVVLLSLLVGPACAGNIDQYVREGGVPARCGLAAAMDYRQPEALRDSPPACALPTAEQVAFSCGVHDLATSPDHRPPIVDEEGIPTGSQPIPEYGMTGLSCRFASRHRNRADCNFRLALPQGQTIGAAVTLEHLFWQDHGAAHHFYGTRWSVTGRCVPLPTPPVIR